MKKVLLVDMNLLFHRCYIVVTLINDQGVEIGGYYQTIRSLFSIIKKTQPDVTVCIWDGKGGSSARRQDNKSYKEGRKVPNKVIKTGIDDIDFNPEKRMESISWQMGKVSKILSYIPVIQLSVDGCEADDIIAYLTNRFKEFKDTEVIISSNDKDFLQLIDTNVSVFRQTKVKDKYVNELYNIPIMKDKYGFHGKTFLIYRMFDGDKSDNLTGINGIGIKTFQKNFLPIIEQYNLDPKDFITFLEQAYKSLDSIQDKSLAKYIKKIGEYFDTSLGVNGIDLLKMNYNIMQLQNSIIDPQKLSQIETTIQEFEPSYSNIVMFSTLYGDGINNIMMSENDFSTMCNMLKFKTNEYLDEKFGTEE